MNELTTQEPPEARAALALKSTQTEVYLRALAVKNASIVQVIDKAGREQAHGAAMELKRARVEIQKTGDEAREDATKYSKAVIVEVKRLVGFIEPEETRLFGLRNAWDDEQARIKAEEEAKEKARIAAIRGRIAEIRNFSTQAALCRIATGIAELLGKLQKFDLGGFDEFAEEASAVHAAAVSGVEFMLAEKQKEEDYQARIKAQQEADRLRIKAEQDAAAAELKQAQEKARAEQAAAAAKLAEERAAMEKERVQIKAKQDAEQAAIAAKLAAERAVIEKERAAVDKERAEMAAAKADALQAIEDTKPKAEPVAMQEPVPTPSPKVIEPVPMYTRAPVLRPTDMEIIGVLSRYFCEQESMVIDWLRTMNLDALAHEIGAIK